MNILWFFTIIITYFNCAIFTPLGIIIIIILIMFKLWLNNSIKDLLAIYLIYIILVTVWKNHFNKI